MNGKNSERLEVDVLKTNKILEELKREKYLYLLFLPGLLFYIIFKYLPMFGIIIAFKDYNVFDGFIKSEWVGFKYFISFFTNFDAWKIIRNTLLINLYAIVFGFPAPIVLALLLNEVKANFFRRFVQSVSYLPHFVSVVVIASLVIDSLSPKTGIISLLISSITGNDPVMYMAKAEYFRFIYISTNIWSGIGWGAIIYMASLSGIDPALYEASTVDGANRFQRMIHITLPGIMPTIIIVFILRLGYMLDVGFDLIFLMQNTLNYATSDVISTYVYRRGIAGGDLSFATAVGLFQSLVGFILIVVTNRISRRVSDVSLW